MPRNLLIDTDVLIDYLTAREEAVAELYAGVREGKERVIPPFLNSCLKK